MSEGDGHRAIVAFLVKQGFSKSEFRVKVQAYLDSLGETGINVPSGVVPDAYFIDNDMGVIRVFEVEIGNPLPYGKLSKYAMFWFDLDSTDLDVDFEVFAIDGHANATKLDLAKFAYIALSQGS